MAKDYIVVKHIGNRGVNGRNSYWAAYYKGLLSRFGVFNFLNLVLGSISYVDKEECVGKLLALESHFRTEIVDELTIS